MALAEVFINGSTIDINQKHPVNNPAFHSEVVGEVAMASEAIVNDAIEAADKAFLKWAEVPLQAKSALVKQAISSLRLRVEELTSLFVRESGKTLVEAKIDISRSIDVIEITPETLKEWYEVQDYSNEVQTVKLLRRPRGVTTIITPWNSPVILTMKRVIPALLTGNTVVVKPATNCPLTITTILTELAKTLPPGVLNIVTGSSKDIGDSLFENERIKTISFVGSTKTGKHIIEKSSNTIKRLHLELGGNDPAIILDDVVLDEDNITKIKNGILRNAGQVCSAIKRIYVHESRYDELLNKLGRAFNKVIVGEGIHPDSTMGAINNKGQLNYVNELIEDTKKNGGVVQHFGQKLNGEKWDKGYFILPAIATNVTQQSRIIQEEQFGPIIPILKFENIDTAIAQANDSPYGLRASIWTENEQMAMELSKRIQAGAIFHNNHTIFKDLKLDFPGVKESGLGNETLHNGFEHFTESFGFAN